MFYVIILTWHSRPNLVLDCIIQITKIDNPKVARVTRHSYSIYERTLTSWRKQWHIIIIFGATIQAYN